MPLQVTVLLLKRLGTWRADTGCSAPDAVGTFPDAAQGSVCDAWWRSPVHSPRLFQSAIAKLIRSCSARMRHVYLLFPRPWFETKETGWSLKFEPWANKMKDCLSEFANRNKRTSAKISAEVHDTSLHSFSFRLASSSSQPSRRDACSNKRKVWN